MYQYGNIPADVENSTYKKTSIFSIIRGKDPTGFERAALFNQSALGNLSGLPVILRCYKNQQMPPNGAENSLLTGHLF